MDDTSDANRLDAAIKRLEAALAKRVPDADLRHKHEALTAEAEATIAALDRILSSAEAA